MHTHAYTHTHTETIDIIYVLPNKFTKKRNALTITRRGKKKKKKTIKRRFQFDGTGGEFEATFTTKEIVDRRALCKGSLEEAVKTLRGSGKGKGKLSALHRARLNRTSSRFRWKRARFSSIGRTTIISSGGVCKWN